MHAEELARQHQVMTISVFSKMSTDEDEENRGTVVMTSLFELKTKTQLGKMLQEVEERLRMDNELQSDNILFGQLLTLVDREYAVLPICAGQSDSVTFSSVDELTKGLCTKYRCLPLRSGIVAMSLRSDLVLALAGKPNASLSQATSMQKNQEART